MGAEKKIYQVRLSDNCKVDSKMVNGVVLTKKWQVKAGDPDDFDKFPDVNVQEVVQQGNTFVAVGKAQAASKPVAKDADANSNNGKPDFDAMTVEQLRNYLIATGVAASELKTLVKPDLVERAEYLWSLKK